MVVPEIPPNETERLKALDKYHILDTDPEVEFDNITKLAALICDTPVSLISLIDDKRQWIKSSYGLDLKETPRDISFCAHAINEPDKLMEVVDASNDERFHDNPIVSKGLKLSFYAGSPIIDVDGFCLGTLCVVDQKVNKLTNQQKEMMSFLSKQVATQLELRKKNYLLNSASEQIKNDQKKLKRLVEHVGDIIYELDDTGKFIYVNPAIVKISGFTEKTLLKSYFWELAAPGTEQDLGRYYLGVIKKQLKSTYHEFQMKTKKGSIWVGQNVEIEYEGKRAVHVYAVARDINDLVNTRLQLVENSEKYRLISENSKDIISLHDMEGNYTFVSPSMATLGYEPKEMIGRSAYSLVHPDEIKDVIRQCSEDLSAYREIRKVECRLKKKDGSYVWVEINLDKVKNSEGKAVGLIASARDISNRKEKEFELERNQAKLGALIDNTDDAICMIDDNYRFLTFNRTSIERIEYLTGVKPVIGEPINLYKIDSRLSEFQESVKAAFTGKRLNKTFSFKENGEICYMDCHFNPVYEQDREIFGLAIQIRDVSKKMRVAERYRLLSENSRDVISLVDKNANYQYLSSSVKEVLGYDYHDLIGRNSFELTHPDDISRLKEEKVKDDRAGKSVRFVTSRRRKKTGEYIWMESTIRVILDDKDNIEGYQITSRDISQRNIHELNIVQNQAKIEALIENTEDAICVIDKENKYLSFNNSFKDQMEFFNGYTPMVGEVFDFDNINSKSPGFELSVKKAMQNKKFNVLHSFEHNAVRQYFDCFYNPVVNQHGEIFGLTIRIQNVTEKTQNEIRSEQFRKATQNLNEIFSQTDFTLYQQINQALIVASKYFEFDIAALSVIDQDDYTVSYCSLRTINIQISPNDKFRLKDMYCSDVHEKSFYKTIDESNEGQYKKHFSNTKLNIKSYIGAPYHVNNLKRGTLWLGSHKSKKPSFTDQEVEFINILSRGIGFLIERHEFRDQLLSEQVVLKAFVFSAPASIAMFNEKLEYVAVSKKWKQEYNLSQQEVLGKHFAELSPHLKDNWGSILSECLKGKVEKNDYFKNYKEDGSEQWLKWEIRPWILSKDKVGGIIMFTEDITEQIEQQRELTRAKEMAEEASRAKEQFLSTMSHEIRTPMNAIVGATNLLLQGNPKPQQIDNLNLLKFSSGSLLSIINDILDFNKIGAGKIEFEQIDFNLKDLLISIKQSLKIKAEENGLDLILKYDEELPDVFVGDSVRIAQIINNLVSNAIKFTHEGYVKIEVLKDSSFGKKHKVNFRIQDTGVGIAKEDKQRIFEDFSQASGITRKYGGTGLGLSITKRLLELMGSTIKVASKKDKGTVFYFDLDLTSGGSANLDSNTPSGFEASNELSKKQVTILVAEDNKANRKIIEQFLTIWNVTTHFAVNGKEAIEKIQSKIYDLVIMDLRMPEMDGYDASINIRNQSDRYFKEVPIIALTASATLDIRERAKRIGINDFVSKPFNPDELCSKILKYAPIFKKKKDSDMKGPLEKRGGSLENSFPYLYQISDGNEMMIREIITTIVDTVPYELEKIEQLFHDRSFNLLAATIHKVKPNIESVELIDLYQLADELDEAASREDSKFIEKNLDHFVKFLNEELIGIKKHYLTE